MLDAGRRAGKKMASDKIKKEKEKEKNKKKIDSATGSDPGNIDPKEFKKTKGDQRVKRASKNQIKKFKSLFFVK